MIETEEAKEFLQELIEDHKKDFKKYALRSLEVFDDRNTNWEKNSGFPFLHITSREYYLQKHFEEELEGYVRYILIKNVLASLLIAYDHTIKFLEKGAVGVADVLPYALPQYKRNLDCEREIGFEFVETKQDKHIGFRYTFLPTGRIGYEKIKDVLSREHISEIVILDWSLKDTASMPGYPLGPYYENILVRYITIKDFFSEYLHEDLYTPFISYLKSTVREFQEYIGAVSIPRLTPAMLFKTRFEVESSILEHLSQMEVLRTCWKNPPDNFEMKYAYRIIEEENRQNCFYYNLEQKSKELLFNTAAIRRYKKYKFYRALIGRGDYARCLITSEYLFRNYGKSDLFDYTAIVSGYLKSVEQLMYQIALFSLDKKRSNGKYYQIKPKGGQNRDRIDFVSNRINDFDTSLGALCNFFKDNKDVLLIGNPFSQTLINCLFCYSKECRNDSFHKHNISEWERVVTIRNNTFFMYILLLGCCRLGADESETIEKLKVATDDRITRIYYQLKQHDTLNYYVCFTGQEEQLIYRPYEEEYPSFDEYGILKSKTLALECDYSGQSDDDREKYITISEDHLPDRIYYPDDNDWSIEHNLVY